MATIGKTFSDPDKWESTWFSKLTPDQKLLFIYMWERCDHSGVIECIPAVWSAHIGLEIDSESLQSLTDSINTDKERLKPLQDKYWFTEYIRFNQQSDPEKPLSKDYSFHKHVYKRILHHGLVDEILNRDPILLKEFVSPAKLKPYLSLTEGLTKSTGKGTSKGKGLSKGTPLNNGINESELEPFTDFKP